MNKMLYFVLCSIFVIVFVNNKLYASSWTRQKNEFYFVTEFLSESDNSKKIFIDDNNSDYFKTNSYKLYVEYGILENITIGGYLKEYNFYSQYFDEYGRKIDFKIKKDLYANVFAIQSIYNKNKNLFSLEYSHFFPVKYDDLSKYINNIDTKNSYSLRALFGSDKIVNIFDNKINYYLDLAFGYKIINNANYDEIKSNFVIGFRTNPSSTIILEYENKIFLESDILPNKVDIYDSYYEDNNSDKFQISFDYKFLDYLSTKISFYRNFSSNISNGVIFSFIFDFV